MKKITIYIVLGMLCFFFKVQAQDNAGHQGLQPGDKVPDLIIKNISHYPGDSIRLHEFGNKLLILDFWATSCGSCIEMFPEDLALQQRYGDSIQFVLVDSKNTRDTKTRVERFFATHQAYTRLPSITEDTVLFNLFPHLADPDYIWIKNDTVLAISGAGDVNEKTISRILSGKSISLTEDKVILYHPQQPLFLNGNGGTPDKYLYRLIITPYQDGLRGAIYFDRTSSGQVNGYRFVNTSRADLYKLAYPQYNYFDVNRAIYRVSHPEDFALDSTSMVWKKHNLFIYEASFPPVSKIAAIQYMRDELDRVFHLTIDTEYRDTTCLIIRKGKVRPVPAKKQTEAITFNNETFLRDFALSDLVDYLNERSNIPVIDEAGFKGSFRMNSELVDLSVNDVLSKLKKEGFVISRERRRLSYLVFSEKQATP
jgi:thiol-disulfide isomerase/thioredoxin